MSYLVYETFREDGETPFYVGLTKKAADERIGEHVYSSKKGKKTHKNNIFAKVMRTLGHIPFVVVAKGLSKEDAAEIEKRIIARYGRYPNGPLVNGTDGGDGIVGFVVTDEYRARLSAARRRYVVTAEHRKNISLGKLGHIQPESAKLKMSISKKALGVTPAMRAAFDAKIGIKHPEAGRKIGDALRGVPKTPEHIEAARAALLASPAWAAYNERRRGSRKGDSAPPPVEA